MIYYQGLSLVLGLHGPRYISHSIVRVKFPAHAGACDRSMSFVIGHYGSCDDSDRAVSRPGVAVTARRPRRPALSRRTMTAQDDNLYVRQTDKEKLRQAHKLYHDDPESAPLRLTVRRLAEAVIDERDTATLGTDGDADRE